MYLAKLIAAAALATVGVASAATPAAAAPVPTTSVIALAAVAPCVAIGGALLARERDALNALQLGET